MVLLLPAKTKASTATTYIGYNWSTMIAFRHNGIQLPEYPLRLSRDKISPRLCEISKLEPGVKRALDAGKISEAIARPRRLAESGDIPVNPFMTTTHAQTVGACVAEKA
ncbi:hypothetical protein M8J77_011837 [Diaphorina citri]|nr:hypothetical protein M8J77_011837 [Diaphorina citri]